MLLPATQHANLEGRCGECHRHRRKVNKFYNNHTPRESKISHNYTYLFFCMLQYSFFFFVTSVHTLLKLLSIFFTSLLTNQKNIYLIWAITLCKCVNVMSDSTFFANVITYLNYIYYLTLHLICPSYCLVNIIISYILFVSACVFAYTHAQIFSLSFAVFR